MFSPLLSAAFVGLHAGQRVTAGGYLVRVLGFLLAFAALALAVFMAVRLVGLLLRTVRGDGAGTEHAP